MRVDVEVRALEPVVAQVLQERGRRDRRPRVPRGVVAVRVGRAAADDFLGEVRGVDARPDRRADADVRLGPDRAVARHVTHALVILDLRAAPTDLRPLGLQEDRVVRLVPGEPLANGRQDDAVVPLELAAIALRGREGEVAQVGHLRRGAVRALELAVRPLRRAEDREQHLDLVLVRVEQHAVVGRPVVGRVGRVGRLGRLARGDQVPVQVQADDLRPQVDERREGRVRRDDRLHRVVDADEHAAGGARRLRPGRRGQHTENDRDQGDAGFLRPQVAPFRGLAIAAAAPLPG